MKLLYVSQYFPPEMGAPAARVSELAREWVRQGHEVTVVTGFPNHPTGRIREGYRGALLRRERVDGVEVLRLPLYATANRGVVRRALSFLSFALSVACLGPFLVGRPDVVVGTSPQPLGAAAAWWLALLLRARFVLEVRDLWPRSVVELRALGSRSPAVRLLRALERFLYTRADQIVAVSSAFVAEIVAAGGRRDRIAVVTNGVDLARFQPGERARARAALGLPDQPLLCYVGTLGQAQGLDLVLDAAPRLHREGISVLLVGDGAERARLEARAAAEGLAGVTFWGEQPRARVPDILAASDVCLVPLRDLPVFRTAIPSKIFEAMGCARPIVLTVDGEARRVVEAAGAGVFVPPGQPEALAEAVRALVGDPARCAALGRAGRRAAEAHYDRAALAGAYLEILLGAGGEAAR